MVVEKVLAAFAKLRMTTIGFVMSVRPHRATRLHLDGFYEICF